MKRLGIILTLLLLALPGFAAQIVTATVTITNAAGTTEGDTLTVNGITRTFRDSIVTAHSDIQATNAIAEAATNLFTQIASFMFQNLTLSLSGTNGINLGTAPNGALSVSLSAGWGTVALTTNTIGTGGAVANIPYTLNSAAQQTNITSGIVAMVGAAENTNTIAETARAVTNLVGRSNAQTVTGAKTFTGANTYSNSSQLFSGGIVTNVIITNAIRISGTTASLTNGGYLNPSLTNGQNFGNAFSSPGKAGILSEEFGLQAIASGDYTTALGAGSKASNLLSTAIGALAWATQTNSTAFGAAAQARAVGATAIGSASTSIYENSTAIGTGSSTTTSNQMRIGTSSEWASIPGNLTVDGRITNITAAGMANWPAGSDIAFARYALTTIANGVNSGIIVGTNTFVELSGPTAAFNTAGFAGGRNGKLLIIIQRTGQLWTIPNESGSEPVSGNRIATFTGADVLLPGSAGAILIYNSAAARWNILTTSVGGSGGGATNAIANTNGFGYGIVTLQGVVATNFYGDGSGLTNLSVSGSAGIATNGGTGINNIFTNALNYQTTSAGVRTQWIDTVTGNLLTFDNTGAFGWHYSTSIYSPSFIGNGPLLTNINVSKLAVGNTSTSNNWVGTFTGDGSGITGIVAQKTDYVSDISTNQIPGSGVTNAVSQATHATNADFASYVANTSSNQIPYTAITNAPWSTSNSTNLPITITGTANRVTVSGSPVYLGGTVTLSGPQDLNTNSSPLFSGVKLSGLSPSKLTRTDSNTNLASAATAGTLSFDGTTLTGLGILTNNGAGTNNTFTTPAIIGKATVKGIDGDVLGLGGGPFDTLPDVSAYGGGGVLLSPLSGVGIYFYNRTAGSSPHVTWYQDLRSGVGGSELIGPRSYWQNNRTENGATYTSYADSMGGSAGAMRDLPSRGNEIWSNQRKPAFVIAISDVSTHATNATQQGMTNLINSFYSRGWGGLTNYGIPLVYDLENYWLTNHRSSTGVLQWNTNKFPMATTPSNVSYYLGTNGFELWLMMYADTASPRGANTEYDIDALTGATSWEYPDGVNNIPGGGLMQPTITPNWLHGDVTTFYQWGVGGITLQDTTTLAASGIGYEEQLWSMFGKASCYPGPLSYPSVRAEGHWQNNYPNRLNSHGMVLNFLFPPESHPFPMAMEYAANGAALESGSFPVEAGTSGLLRNFISMLRVSAYSLTNWMPHTIYWVLNSDYLAYDGWNYGDCKDFLSGVAMSTAHEWIRSNDGGALTNTTLRDFSTNANYISIWQDPAQNRMHSAFFGATNLAMVKPLSDGSFALWLVNEDAAIATNLTVNWSQVGIQSNVTARAVEMWTNTTLGVYTNSLTVNVPAASSTLIKLIPDAPGMQALYVSNFYSTLIEGDTFHGKITIVSNVFATNIFATNIFVNGSLNLSNIAANKILRSTTNQSVGVVTVGAGLDFDGTNLISTANALTNHDARGAIDFTNTSLTVYGAFTNTGFSKGTTNYMDRLYLSNDAELYRESSSFIKSAQPGDGGSIGLHGYDLKFDNRLYQGATMVISENADAFLRDFTTRIVSGQSSSFTNGFSSDGSHYTKMPTNTPGDGQVITAVGTAGVTKWATPSAGGSSGTNFDNITVTNGIASLNGNLGSLSGGLLTFGSPKSVTNTTTYNVQAFIDDDTAGAATITAVSINGNSVGKACRYTILQPGEYLTISWSASQAPSVWQRPF